MKDKKSIFFIEEPNGKVWDSTVSFTERETTTKFVNGWHPRETVEISLIACRYVWSCYQKAGWKIKEVELPKEEKSQDQ